MRWSMVVVAAVCPGLAACTSPSSSSSSDPAVELTGTVESGAQGYRGVVVLSSARPTQVQVGGVCLPALLVYRDSAASEPAWDEQRWFNTRAGGCKWMPVTVEVPGHIATPSVSAAAILGDSLPAGAYMARIRVLFARWVPLSGSASTTVVDSTHLVDAGTLQLAP